MGKYPEASDTGNVLITLRSFTWGQVKKVVAKLGDSYRGFI